MNNLQRVVRQVLFSSHFHLTQMIIPAMPWLGIPGYIIFYYTCRAQGYREILVLRLLCAALFVPVLFFPLKKPLSSAQKIYWETSIFLALPLFFSYMFFLNDTNMYWWISVSWAGLVYGGVCSKVLLAMILFPIGFFASAWIFALQSHVPIVISGNSIAALSIGWLSAGVIGSLKFATNVYYMLTVEQAKEIERQSEELKKSYAAIQKEILAAREIQQALLPSLPQSYGTIQFESLYRPCEHLSGDFYDIIPCGEKVFFYVADVTSHGTASAQVTYLIKSLCQRLLSAPDAEFTPLPDLIRAIHRGYVDYRLDYDMAFQLGSILRTSGTMNLVRCQAPTPLHVSEGEAYPIRSRSAPGFSCSESSETIPQIEVSQVSLGKTDCVFLYTDGAYEFMSTPMNRGEKRLHDILCSLTKEPWAESLLKELTEANTKGLFEDDLTVLRISLGGKQSS
jgi:serine phosphatase RsbU (regulator of sigma subunit)